MRTAFEIVESIKIKAKSVTLSSTLLCPPLTAKHANQNSQLIHVALETKNPTDMNALRSGLHSLRDSDPAVEIKHLTTGELVLFVSGEVHLERCLKDLRECFCFVDFNVSDPMVSFKETFVNANPDKMWSYSPNAGSLFKKLIKNHK
ncbi:hypothetical protein GJ496_004247 [Pomphorhynchus laevis]|nr:hypothetical protein GJ496_004247 [Pomphorhynchus laevis]